MFGLDLDFNRSFERLGQALDEFQIPTRECKGFVNPLPQVEIRVYVSLCNY